MFFTLVCNIVIFICFLIIYFIAKKAIKRNSELQKEIKMYIWALNVFQGRNKELLSSEEELKGKNEKLKKENQEKSKAIDDMNETLVRNQRVLKERKKKIDCQRKIISNRDKKILKLTSKKNAN